MFNNKIIFCMNSKFSDWAIRIFAVLYACACVGAMINDCAMKKDAVNCNITMIFENLTEFENVEFCWIDGFSDAKDVDNIDNFIYGDAYKLNENQFNIVMNPDFYIEKGDDTALGFYHPVGMLKFQDKSGNRYSVMYSFLNAEARIYLNGKIQKAMMIYNPDDLSNFLNNL